MEKTTGKSQSQRIVEQFWIGVEQAASYAYKTRGILLTVFATMIVCPGFYSKYLDYGMNRSPAAVHSAGIDGALLLCALLLVLQSKPRP